MYLIIIGIRRQKERHTYTICCLTIDTIVYFFLFSPLLAAFYNPSIVSRIFGN